MTESKFVENMSEGKIEHYQKRLYPASNDYGLYGYSSVTGFLAEDEKLLDVVRKDLVTLKQHNLSIEMICDRLDHLIVTALMEINVLNQQNKNQHIKEIVIEKKYKVEINVSDSYQYCPFTHVPHKYRPGKKTHIYDACDQNCHTYTITNLINGKTITFSGLLPHLIRDHHFFEGNVPHRLDPLKIITVIDTDLPDPFKHKMIEIYAHVGLKI
jgi:hypothetical protein